MSPTGVAAPGGAALSLVGITKRFGSTVAVEDVSLAVRPGTVHALLGENGAGKTTLMRVAFGLVRPDSGHVLGGAPPRRIASAADAMHAGLGMMHQHFTNVPAMTVAENVALGGRGRFDAARAARTVQEIGERTGLVLDPSARASDLGVGAQQRLEIVKALARNARTLILDEPTAVLAPAEADELLRWLRSFAREDRAAVLITHKLREGLAVADDVTILRRGRFVRSGSASAESIESLTAALLGESGAPHQPPSEVGTENPNRGGVIVAAKGLSLTDSSGATRLAAATFELHRGEITGIAAVEGSGQHELLRALAGRLAPSSGSLTLPRSVAFIPEDRHRDALVLDFSLAENVALKGAGARRGRMSWTSIRSRTEELLVAMDVRGGNAATNARALSGGNQQKLVLARELDGAPDLVVAENPTRGLDIRATADVLARLRGAARAGAAVAIFSSDLDEVLGLADRILVVHQGTVREVPHDRDAVGRAMLGVA